MKKNKLIYLIFTLILIFNFNSNVYAAQELTCVYTREWSHDKVILIQYANGTRKIIKNPNNVSIEEAGWRVSTAGANNFEDGIDKDNLTKCPKYLNTSDAPNTGRVTFFNTDELFDTKVGLEKNGEYKEVKEPPFSSVTSPKSTSGWLTDLDNNRYTGSCMYEREIINENTGVIEKHIVQIDFGNKDILATEYDPMKGQSCSGIYGNALLTATMFCNPISGVDGVQFRINQNITAKTFIDEDDGNCPMAIKVDRKAKKYTGEAETVYTMNTEVNLPGAKGDTYFIVDVRGKNPINNEDLVIDINPEIGFIEKDKIENCEDLFGETITGWLKLIWNLIKFGIPVLLLGLGVLDFAQAIFSANEDAMKKAQTKFIKRVIIAVVIFLIPTILGLLLKLANNVWGNIGTDICGILR